MPLYEYLCNKCGKKTEVIQRFGEAPIRVCPHCGGRVKKAISAPAIQFKGSGWYVTDYARGGSKESGGRKESDSSSDSKAEKSEKSESAGKSESADKKAEKAEKSERSEKSEKAEKAEKKAKKKSSSD